MPPDQTPTTPSRWIRAAFYGGVALSAILLVLSIVTWNVLLGLGSLALALPLYRRLDIVGVAPERPQRMTKETAAAYRRKRPVS
ncbi:hypothetical protein RM844_25450 [Streptomyces sp. DSM 44915]|uniref:DUF4229 domain-containing protein n=1 Tax=Streptomyces chisholmiae TaxID=3075540 RepID=A0ABU2JZJ9_9ACTN|nr:hypothetical protein [Streptomyces sp. DSM 44915]MDT0269633.1 hypothetical protein [Streptomyces sp. DSM 44915]